MGLGPSMLQSTISPLSVGQSGQSTATGPPPNTSILGAMQQQQQESQTSGSQSSQQSTSPHSYYGPDQQQLNSSGDPQQQQQMTGGAMGATPLSPHLQQNGYGTSVASATGNGQLQNYSQQQAPHNGGQGTWTGPNTLTYTSTMQPPDSRNSHNAYCKCLCGRSFAFLIASTFANGPLNFVLLVFNCNFPCYMASPHNIRSSE